MFSTYRKFMLFGLLLLALVVAAPAAALEVGQAPPDFTLKRVDTGEEVKLSDYRGRTIVLKISTTTCTACREQIEELARIDEFLVENDILLLEVYFNEPRSMVREHLQERTLKVPTVAVMGDRQMARDYRLFGVPRVILIDCSYTVRRDRGKIYAADLQRKLEGMLLDKADKVGAAAE